MLKTASNTTIASAPSSTSAAAAAPTLGPTTTLASTAARTSTLAPTPTLVPTAAPTWADVDRELRSIAKRRAALDADEARWLREAERLKIWEPLGMVSALDYLERALGYAPRTALDRLRVARALGSLAQLEAALEHGELAFSAVREITRVATPDTEAEWCQAARDLNLRQIETLVADRQKGDRPTDRPKPEIRNRTVTFELPPEVYALLRQVTTLATEERGQHVDDHELISTLCRAFLDRGSDTETTGRAKYVIAMTVCAQCDQGWQHGGGRKIPVGAATVERARCNAVEAGSIDGDAPERASQTIPPAVVRFVQLRDGGACQTPGCRSTVGVEQHHITPRSQGGSHHPSNITSRCDGCHVASHDGRLLITGTAPDNVVTTWITAPAPNLDRAIAVAQARDALVGLGWKAALARAAVERAHAHVGAAASLEAVIREALRRCPELARVT